VKRQHIIWGGLVAISFLLVVFMSTSSNKVNKKRLSEFDFTPTDYGWSGSFPGEKRYLFGKEISLRIDTRLVPNNPKTLPPISKHQAELTRTIAIVLPAALKKVEEAMVGYNDHDPDFRSFIRDPGVWLDSEHDDGLSWTFVVERTDNPDFGYHVEFKGTNFVEIWAGD